MDETMYERARNLMEAELGDELVALDVQDGQCFGFSAAAASVWQLLDTPKSMAALVEALTAQYAVDTDACRADVAELLESMRDMGLIRRSSSSSAATAA